jgi:hypothetical protein
MFELFASWFVEEAGYVVESKYIHTAMFKALLNTCVDEQDKPNFNDEIYEEFIKRNIIKQGNYWIFFNQSDYFVPNKYNELSKLLNENKYNFSENTKQNILEYYKKETGMIMNVVNVTGGGYKRKTIKKRKRTNKMNKTK